MSENQDEFEGLYRRKPQVSGGEWSPSANQDEWEGILRIFQSLGPDEIADFLRTLSASDNPELVTECFSILSQFHNEE